MAKTVNRIPVSVNVPTSSQTKQYSFNYSQWKGMCDDKNYIGVDQETFEECNNIYIDEKGILRSRPAIKVANIHNLKNVVKVWNFDILQVYEVIENNKRVLKFVKDDIVSHTTAIVPEDFVLVLADRKVFLFSINRIAYLDIDEMLWYDSNSINDNEVAKAIATLYIPVTTVDVGDKTTIIESENELLSSAKTIYKYPTIVDINEIDLNNKDVTIKIGDTTYLLRFSLVTKDVLVENTYDFRQNPNLVNEILYPGTGQHMFVETSRDGKISIISYRVSSQDTLAYTITYSFDYKTYKVLDTVTDVLYKPLLSEDGSFVVIFKDDGPYAKSINPILSNGGLEFPDWTNLLHGTKYTNSGTTTYNYSENIAINTYTNNLNKRYRINMCIGGQFVDSNRFSFVYGINPIRQSNNKYKYSDYVGMKFISYNGIFSSYSTIPTTQPGAKRTIYDYDISLQSVDLADNFIQNINTTGETTFSISTTKTDINPHLAIYSGLSTCTLANSVLTVNLNNLQVKIGTKTVSTLTKTIQLSLSADEVNSTETLTVSGDEFSADSIVKITIKATGNKPVGSANYILDSFFIEFDVNIINEKDTSNNSIYIGKNISIIMPTNNIIVAMISQTTGSGLPGTAMYVINTSNSNINKNYLQTYITNRTPTLPSLNYSTSYVYVLIDGIKSGDTTVNSHDLSKFEVTINDLTNNTGNKSYTNISNDNTYVSYVAKIATNGDILTNKYLIRNNEYIPLLSETFDRLQPVFINATNIVYTVAGLSNNANKLYTNMTDSSVTVSIIINNGVLKIPSIDFVSKLQNYYFVSGNKLMINAKGGDLEPGEFKWYFPKINTEKFDYDITAIHPISQTEMAVFFEHAIQYVVPTEQGYTYYKSRIPLGCKYGCDIITSYDGKFTIFATQRGLVAMSYQDFISSTEQALTYLSDNIFGKFDKWNVGAIKLMQYKFWLIIYRIDSLEAFVLDMRNNSWWPVEVKRNCNQVYSIDNVLYSLFENTIYSFDTSDTDYKDTNGIINWSIVSQKLHLNAVNYYKHVLNMLFNTVNDTDSETTFVLNVINYSDFNIVAKPKTIQYTVDMIGTTVKRLNCPKAKEFQFVLMSDDNKQPVPLSLTNICIKYKLTGGVE